MNGIRVIRTIAFDLIIGSKVVTNDRTMTVRGFDIERQVVTLEVDYDDVFLQTVSLSKLKKVKKTIQVPIANVVGANKIVVISDKLLTIGDIPYE